MPDRVSSKILSADALASLLASDPPDDHLESFVVPTAEELLALTEAALSDVENSLPLTDDHRNALRAALRQRLAASLQPEKST